MSGLRRVRLLSSAHHIEYQCLAEGTEPAWRWVELLLRARLTSGVVSTAGASSLGKSLGRYPPIFQTLCLSSPQVRPQGT